VERESDMTISFGPRHGVHVTGSKKMVWMYLEVSLVDGLFPARGHGGVRYACFSIPRTVSQIIFV
jgi:hypothetical protein